MVRIIRVIQHYTIQTTFTCKLLGKLSFFSAIITAVNIAKRRVFNFQLFLYVLFLQAVLGGLQYCKYFSLVLLYEYYL